MININAIACREEEKMKKYPVLECKMKEKGISRRNIADLLDVRYATVIDKLKGRSPFTYEEAEMVKNAFFAEITLEELFAIKDKVG